MAWMKMVFPLTEVLSLVVTMTIWIHVAVMTRFRAMLRQGVRELGACFPRHRSRAIP
jgi:hypothetical protein